MSYIIDRRLNAKNKSAVNRQRFLRRYREQTPLVRTGVPDDSAHAIRFFAGPESSWITGQCLTIDGGMDLRGAPDLSSALSRFRELTESSS